VQPDKVSVTPSSVQKAVSSGGSVTTEVPLISAEDNYYRGSNGLSIGSRPGKNVERKNLRHSDRVVQCMFDVGWTADWA